MTSPLYHVAPRALLESTTADRTYAPDSLASEGFVHCCYRHQLAGVLDRYFRGAGELALLELDPLRVGPLRHESAPGASERFPHVYAALPAHAVRRRFPLAAAGGGHALPPEIATDLAHEQRELDALLAAYAWYDHPEGPKFVETHRDEHRTSGHWLFSGGAISAFHRVLNGEELWIAQRGALRIHVVGDDGEHVEHVLGLDLEAGQSPVLAVARGALQAAEVLDGERFAFGVNVCAPPFRFDRFELTARAEMLQRLRDQPELAVRLTYA